MSQRDLPSNVELEKVILGALLLKGRVDLAIGVLDASCFSIQKHRDLWVIMAELHEAGTHVDRITVATRAKALQLTELSLTYLISLDDELPEILHLDDYVIRLKDIGVRREAILHMEMLGAKLADLSNDSVELLSDAARVNDALSTAAQPDRGVLTGKQAIEAAGGLDGLLESASVTRALPTPWNSVQERFPGFAPGKLYIIAGRPGLGKTAWMLQAAWNAAILGDAPYIVSLEMKIPELLNRIFAAQARVNLGRLQYRRLSKEDLRQISVIAHCEAMGRFRLTDEAVVTVAAIRNRVLKLNPRPGLVVVDYLQLMKSSGSTRTEEVSAISRGLKMLAMECHVAVMALSQLSRPEKRDGSHRPQLTDLRDSGAIEQDADMVGFLWGPQPKEDAIEREVFFDIAKQRNGPLSQIIFTFNGGLQRFEEVRNTTNWQEPEPTQETFEL